MSTEELVMRVSESLDKQRWLLDCLSSDLEECDRYTVELINWSRISTAAITEINRRACELAAKKRK